MKQHYGSRIVLPALVAALLCLAGVAAAQTPSEPDTVGEMLRERLSTGPDGRLEVAGQRLRSPGTVRSFYEAGGAAPVWSTGRGFGSLSRGLLDAVRSADSHGLAPERYHESYIERAAALPYRQYRPTQRVDIELVFTDALLTLGADLLKGRAREVELKDASIDAQEDVDIIEVAREALAAGDPRQMVERLAPRALEYQKLRGFLPGLRAMARSERSFTLPEHTLREGDSGEAVSELRRRLQFLGDLQGPEAGGGDVFGSVLARAVKRFQARHGLEVDGIVGRETRPALETSMARRVEQVELTLERWRWLPRDPGSRYLIVNIAGQELDVFRNGRRALHMRVVVGKPFQRTPSFASRIDTVVLNPYWEVPYSIAVNETLPAVRNDPGYLARQNMEVLNRLEAGGDPIDPDNIDWDQVSSRNFPYRFRQKPGPGNSLGLVKFLLPNPYSVYLHDTPAKTLFNRARRCFSHGCVRLEKPFELARLLLNDEPGRSADIIEEILPNEQNHHIRLSRTMPVYLVYWTAWVDKQDTIHFRDDVYGRDARLKAALGELNP
ncbi:MAG TPA: L,D-transpeptidase family protein [Arenicellales bacterium]|nr:L,D-transpeptidase family protein [Arenicellales bacterium]